jgi:hypothetical protein
VAAATKFSAGRTLEKIDRGPVPDRDADSILSFRLVGIFALQIKQSVCRRSLSDELSKFLADPVAGVTHPRARARLLLGDNQSKVVLEFTRSDQLVFQGE